MTILQEIQRTRRLLRLAAALHASGVAAVALGASLGVAMLALPGLVAVGRWTLALAIGATVWWVEFGRRGARRLSLERSALWVEEHVPGMQYALVSTLAPQAPPGALERALDVDAWRRAQRRTLSRAAQYGVALVLSGTLLAWGAGRVLARPIMQTAPSASPFAPRPGGVLSLRATVVAPAYTRLATQALADPAIVHALAGSRMTLDVLDSTATFRVGGRDLPSTATGAVRRSELTVPLQSIALTIATSNASRVLVIDVRQDSVPAVMLARPARDSVLRSPAGTIALGAALRDDFGLASAAFEYIVSSGEGESFTFRSGTVGARTFAGDRSADVAASLSFEAIQLKPGDIVHIRAVARDANDATGPGIGRSETRTIRIARSGEYDSVAVEGAAPPEEDKSVLSQRMLINLAESLRKRRRALPRETYSTEATQLSRDQARLRRQVGDLVFDRLGNNPSGEHAHNERDTGRPLTKEELLAAAEEATKVQDEVIDFAGDETPVTAVNRPLLEAYNAMWDAGRELGVAELEHALPHMYRALAAIQRARQAERLYLRGKAPRVVVDVARVRLQGKDKGASSGRPPRLAVDTSAARDRGRFASAIAALGSAPSAGIDSLLMLRVDLVARNGAAARAIDAAVETLRTGGDATNTLVSARRALEANRIAADSISRWSRGGMP